MKFFLKKNSIDSVSFNIKSICDGHHNITYREVKAIRCPFDYVLYQMILFEVKPDLVIEIGTNDGGGSLYLADILDLIGNKGVLHTIDIVDLCQELPKKHPRIVRFLNGWEGYDIENTKRFEKVLIIEDSSHLYEHTRDILQKFSPVVSKDSYFIVEDSIINELGIENEFNGGPLKAIHEFLKNNKSYIIDRKWCDFFGKNATFNVNGYLKKIN